MLIFLCAMLMFVNSLLVLCGALLMLLNALLVLVGALLVFVSALLVNACKVTNIGKQCFAIHMQPLWKASAANLIDRRPVVN